MIKCRLKVLLAEHDMSQKDLAEKTGIRAATISDMCQNKTKHISIAALDEMCKAFDCDISDIYKFSK